MRSVDVELGKEVRVYRKIRKYSRNPREHFKGKHRFEHWYVDNQVYFITARCRDRYPAFASDKAKNIFWDRFYHYCKEFGVVPLVVSLLDNHYHALVYVKVGLNLKTFMQRLHGSVAKLVNDLLCERREKFWRDAKGKEYFDGCIRDEKQYGAAYRYTQMQARRHGIMYDYLKYKHTRVDVTLEAGLKRALELQAFLQGVPYKRYDG
jgi:REP element-mobilizing transposase RayT